MRKRAVISTPFPTQEQVAEEMGIGKARMRRLMALADEILGTHKAGRLRSTSKKPNSATADVSLRRLARGEHRNKAHSEKA